MELNGFICPDCSHVFFKLLPPDAFIARWGFKCPKCKSYSIYERG